MPISPGMSRALLAIGFLTIACARLTLALGAPAETTDILRNLLYGEAFWEFGFEVYDRTPVELVPGSPLIYLWSEHTYDYPVGTLFLFAFLARISSSLVVARLVLSVVELGNALLVARLVGSPWAGLAWFAGPASIWWVSGEGQFEPLVVLFSLLALRDLERGRDVGAWAWLAVAIQIKLLPLLLLPWFLWRRPTARGAMAFAIAMSPSLAATWSSSYLSRSLVHGYWPGGFNAFAWGATSRWPRSWLPGWIAWGDALLSAGLLVAVLLWLGSSLRRGRTEAAVSLVPSLLFLLILKSVGWGQCWYLLAMPAFAAAVVDARARVCLLLLPLLEVRGASALFLGPVGQAQWFPIERFLDGIH